MKSNNKPTYQHTTLAESERTLNGVLEVVIEGVWDWNANTGNVTRSPGWFRMLGYDVGAFNEDVFTWENIIHPEDYPLVMEHFENYINGNIPKYEIEYRCKQSHGDYLWIVDRGKIIEYQPDGSVARMIGAHHNIHQQKTVQLTLQQQNKLLAAGNLSLEKIISNKAEELAKKNALLEKKIIEIESISNTDTLTLVANRKKFEIELNKEISRAKRYKHKLSLAIFDIDHFKDINDKHGHKVGDLILCNISKLVSNNIRDNDLIARWGGDEFVIIFPEQSKQQAHISCEKIRSLIHQKITIINNATKDTSLNNNVITCSFGVAEFSHHEQINDLFHRVDGLLYQAKAAGRNSVKS
ncbi:MAG: sensor domain-containing diguanylate cyclase [Thalassotalea sp.]